MDFFVGDKLELKATAFDPINPSVVLYTQGTQVTVAEVRDSDIILEFPDKSRFLSSKDEVLHAYNRITEDGSTTLVRVIEGIGSPPKELYSYLPKEATWTHNYRWKVIVQLEDRGKKGYVCPSCKDDLGMFSGSELTKCKNCGTMVIPAKVSDLLP